MKENEQYYPDYISERTYIYFIIGIVSIPLGYILSILFLHEYKTNKDENSDSDNDNNINFINDKKEKEKNIENNLSKENFPKQNEIKEKESKNNIKMTFKNIRLYRISLISLFINFSLSFIGGTGRTFGALIGINGNILQLLIIFQSIMIIFSLFILGTLVDKIGALIILRIVSFICFIPGILLAFLWIIHGYLC